MSQHIEDLFEEKARAGDGSFAIAYALLRLADEQKATAYQIRQLGFGDAATSMGGIEHLTLHLSRTGETIAEALRAIADRD
jgi:hypothetical protein